MNKIEIPLISEKYGLSITRKNKTRHFKKWNAHKCEHLFSELPRRFLLSISIPPNIVQILSKTFTCKVKLEGYYITKIRDLGKKRTSREMAELWES
jgi:hypothetical protein